MKGSQPGGRSPAYQDRAQAGRVLAAALGERRGEAGLVVLGLPRGGVPVANQVAQALGAPLDIWVVRKLGLPGQLELAMGAIASGGVRVMNPLPGLALDPDAVARVLGQEQAELVRREQLYRGPHLAVEVAGRAVFLVDDGLATGATLRAGALAVRARHPPRLTVAAPVGSREGCASLAEVADEVVCPCQPDPFEAVSLWYVHLPQTSDEEVRHLLEAAWRQRLTG